MNGHRPRLFACEFVQQMSSSRVDPLSKSLLSAWLEEGRDFKMLGRKKIKILGAAVPES